MTKQQIVKVLVAMCQQVFKSTAPYDIDAMAAHVEALAAKHRVDPRLALAQGILECHWGMNPRASRSIKTMNIFNVGNVDDGRNRFFKSWEEGVSAYFSLMAREYLYGGEGKDVTPEMMIRHDFIRPRGGRYATAPSYTSDIAKIVARIDKLIGGKNA